MYSDFYHKYFYIKTKTMYFLLLSTCCHIEKKFPSSCHHKQISCFSKQNTSHNSSLPNFQSLKKWRSLLELFYLRVLLVRPNEIISTKALWRRRILNRCEASGISNASPNLIYNSPNIREYMANLWLLYDLHGFSCCHFWNQIFACNISL